MKSIAQRIPRHRIGVGLLLLGSLAAPCTNAQSTKPAAVAAAASNSDVVNLSPFEVFADNDNSYNALNSNAITKFHVELDKMPISADIFDQAFMDDVATTSVEGLLTSFSAGAGLTSATNTAGNSVLNQPGDRLGNAYIQLRGQNTPIMQRDGFMPVGAFGNPGSTGVNQTSTFDLERTEVVLGPQALLYGGGGAGGVINVVSKEARFSQRPFGSLMYTVDQYGSKLGQFDFGVGKKDLAVRFAAMEQAQHLRRQNIGSRIDGSYLMLAYNLFGNTTIRWVGEQTNNHRILASTPAFSGTAADVRNGIGLHDELFTNRAGAVDPVTHAPYFYGAQDNGYLNWSNVDSYGGDTDQEIVHNQLTTLTVTTKITDSLHAYAAAGYDTYKDLRINNTVSYYAPGANSGPVNAGLTGWSIGAALAGGANDTMETQPARTKKFALSLVSDNKLFGAQSQTSVGWDYGRTDMYQIALQFVKADANYNPLGTATATSNGYSALPTIYWSVDHGPVFYTPINPAQDRFTYNGQNYVRVIANTINRGLISPSNPTGAAFTSGSEGDYIVTHIINSGAYGVNYTQWLDGRLDSIVGVRASHSDEFLIQENPNPYFDSTANHVNFNVGLEYRLLPWLRPYANFSDSFTPPFKEGTYDPFKNPPATAHGIGEEFGFKLSTPDQKVSGQVVAYHVSSKNTPYLSTSSFANDVNPTGLNGGGGGGSYITDDIDTKGAQITLTAMPVARWRMRLSAAYTEGTLGKSATYKQVYNDQFHEDTNGNVTFANGQIAYVKSVTTAGSATTAVPASSAPAGYVPLTVTMLSTYGNPYYANPTTVSGAISNTSSGGLALLSTDPVAGAILTGATLLPMSNYQLNPALFQPGIIAPPGAIPAVVAGQKTTGYPEYAVNFTNAYSFDSGWAKGLTLGMSVSMQWRYQSFYYYPGTAVSSANFTTSTPVLFETPATTLFNGWVGYAHKFKRVTWKTQVNVNNMFNHYRLILLPVYGGGFAPANLNATWNSQPRFYSWSNTISF